jgi:UDP-N-acetylmuramyl pentapeptide phosphotransferase/UDP-N-acetylglucosamine-1-phosphate transferase
VAIAVFGAILLSALSAAVLIRYAQLHIRFSGDGVGGGPQKFHHTPTPRIGGVAIFAGLILGLVLLDAYGYLSGPEVLFLVASTAPVFVVGLIEDLTKKVSPNVRLAASFVAAGLAFWLLNAELRRLDVPFIDVLLQITPFALFVSLLCMGGVAHAVNIIDGYNGLAAGVGVIIFSGLGIIGFEANDPFIFSVCAVAVGTLFGFLICNYPRGAIFAGDSGAYLVGFLIALVSVLLVVRNPGVSPWAPMLLAIYPVWETLFSIYRKKYLRGQSPHDPDGLHLHMLIYKRMIRFAPGVVQPSDKVARNASTSPYLWILTAISVAPAVLFWNSTPLLMACCVAFCLLYCEIYWSIVKFRSPGWLRRRIPTSAAEALESEN